MAFFPCASSGHAQNNFPDTAGSKLSIFLLILLTDRTQCQEQQADWCHDGNVHCVRAADYLHGLARIP